MSAYQLGITAAGSVVGTLVACATYSAMRSTAQGSAFAVTQGSRILAFLLGRSTGYVAGTRIGDIVQVTTEALGRDMVAPALRLGGETTAAATAAVTGAGAAIIATGAIHGSIYIGNAIYRVISSNIFSINFLQYEEHIRFDTQIVDEELQNIIPAKYGASQTASQDIKLYSL